MAELKPGQKYPTPTPGFGDRVFYETLFRQRPDSAMAQEWCVYYGVLPFEEAERINKKVVKRKQRLRAGGGASSSSPAPKKKKKVKVVREDGVDPDMQVSGGDGIGRAVL